MTTVNGEVAVEEVVKVVGVGNSNEGTNPLSGTGTLSESRLTKKEAAARLGLKPNQLAILGVKPVEENRLGSRKTRVIYNADEIEKLKTDPRVEALRPKRRRQCKRTAAFFSGLFGYRYSTWRDALLDAGVAMDSLIKHYDSSASWGATTAELKLLKRGLTHVLSDEGHMTAAYKIFKVTAQPVTCVACNGRGNVRCPKCHGTGSTIAQSALLMSVFHFVIGGRFFKWCMPIADVTFRFHVFQRPPLAPWVPKNTVILPYHRFTEAKWLVRWVIENWEQSKQVQGKAA